MNSVVVSFSVYGSPLVPKQDIYYHEKRCIFQLLRCIIPIWRPPLRENEMYISTGEMYYSYLAAARYIWRTPDRNIHLTS